MATFEQVTNNHGRKWECKQCHRLIAPDETVAYHLIDRVLYGWCESCFDHRSKADSLATGLAA